MRTAHVLAALMCPATLLASPIAHASSADSSTKHPACSNPSKVVEWRNMKEKDRIAYLEAEQCMYGPDGWGEPMLPLPVNRMLAAVHQKMTPDIYNSPQFLPWQRFMLYVHDYAMRNGCKYTGPMTWWDETKDAGNFAHAPLFTSDYFGEASPLPEQVTTGAFANQALYVGPGAQNESHYLARNISEAYSAVITKDFISKCNGISDFASMSTCVVNGPNAYAHDAIGGAMALGDIAGSPGDPVYYMHQRFIDRNWRAWQKADPTVRLHQVNGSLVPDCKGKDCQQLTLDFQLIFDQWPFNVTVGDMMDTQEGMLCYDYDY